MLKRIIPSFLVLLILMNVMGYYGLFLGLQYKHSLEMSQLFDEGNYDPALAATLKIPFKSSGKQSEIFERADGDFQQKGEVYRIIKQRLFRDTFHIVYMKDKRGTAINQALADYVKTFSDGSSSTGQTKLIPFFIKEYFSKTISIEGAAPGWARAVRKESHSQVFNASFLSSIKHPPERA